MIRRIHYGPEQVFEDGAFLTVERLPDPNNRSFAWIPSPDYSFQVRETKEVFRVESEMSPREAYNAWRPLQGDLPPVKERIRREEEKEKLRRLCLKHQQDQTCVRNEHLSPTCASCLKILIDQDYCERHEKGESVVTLQQFDLSCPKCYVTLLMTGKTTLE